MAKTFYLSHTALNTLDACNGLFYSKYINGKEFNDVLPDYYNNSRDIIGDDNGIDENSTKVSEQTEAGLIFHTISQIFIELYNLSKIYITINPGKNINDLIQESLNSEHIYVTMFDSISKVNAPMILKLLYAIFAPYDGKRCDYERFKDIKVIAEHYSNNPDPDLAQQCSIIINIFNKEDERLKNGLDAFTMFYNTFNLLFYNIFDFNPLTNQINETKMNAFLEANLKIYPEVNIKSKSVIINNNYTVVFYAIVDIILIYNNDCYIIDLKTGSPRYISTQSNDYSITNQLLTYTYILHDLDNISRNITITEDLIYHTLYIFTGIDQLARTDVTNEALQQFKTNAIDALNNKLLIFFTSNAIIPSSNLDQKAYTKIGGGYLSHNGCIFKSKCNVFNESELKNVPESVIDYKIDNNVNYSAVPLRNARTYIAPNRIGIVNLDYYDCKIITLAGKREPVITNKDQIVSLDQSGQIVYDVKGELDEATLILSFVNSLHMIEVMRFIKAQQVISNIIPFYNSFIAKLFLPYDVYGSYYNKIIGPKVVSDNLNTLTSVLTEPAKYNITIGSKKYDYIDSLYKLIPVYCNITNIKLSTVQEQTVSYIIELVLGKVSIEIMQMYDNKYVSDKNTLLHSINGFMDNEQYKNPFLEIYSGIITSVDGDLDKTIKLK